MHRAISLLICALSLLTQTSKAQPPDQPNFLGHQILPVDQAIGHPALITFRTNLIAAARRHDLKYLLNAADPKIEVCGWEGVNTFREFLTDTEHGGWDSFRSALQLGGVMQSPTMFRSNYTLVNFPEGADYTEYEIAIRPDAAVHQRPDAASPVIARLRYEMVRRKGLEASDWPEIEYHPGKTGYVQSSDLDPGYSVVLQLTKGKWKITAIGSYCD